MSYEPDNPHFRLGIDNITALIPYGQELRRHRRILHESLRKEVMPLYHGKHTEKVHLMIDRLLTNPEDFANQCKWCISQHTQRNRYLLYLQAGRRCHHVYDIWIRYRNGKRKRSICRFSRAHLDRHPRALAARTKHDQRFSVPQIYPSLDSWRIDAEIGGQGEETVDGVQN